MNNLDDCQIGHQFVLYDHIEESLHCLQNSILLELNIILEQNKMCHP